MKLYIGGAYEGQAELARRENPDAVIFRDFHELVRAKLDEGAEINAWLDALMKENPDAVFVSDEVGCGIVPLLPEQRVWREAVGRALCRIAEESESVTRVICGIGVRIK